MSKYILIISLCLSIGLGGFFLINDYIDTKEKLASISTQYEGLSNQVEHLKTIQIRRDNESIQLQNSIRRIESDRASMSKEILEIEKEIMSNEKDSVCNQLVPSVRGLLDKADRERLQPLTANN